MTKYLPTYILLLLMAAAVFGCNKGEKEDEEVLEISYSNVAVTSFSISRNDTVLARLDSVFFSIDLQNALIFNADSLPKGTDVSKLKLKIGLPSVSEATLIEPSGRKVNYLETTTDTIDFSKGAVTLHLVSYDKKAERDYTIKVNVHTMEPDSLWWNRLAVTTLPGSITVPTAVAAVEHNDRFVCLVADDSKAEVSASDQLYAPAWNTRAADLPAGADLSTLRSACGSLYMLADGGTLYESADNGATWSPTSLAGQRWIYGEYNGSLLCAAVAADGSAVMTAYPAMTTATLPEAFPIAGTTPMIVLTTEWAQLPTAVLLGGRDKDGAINPDVWVYDGSKWTVANSQPLPMALEDMALVPYFSFRTNKRTWTTTRYSTLVAFGGRDADGTLNRKVYISMDNGLRWRAADELMQLPDYLPALAGASTLVDSHTMTVADSRACSAWTEMPSRMLPPWFMPAVPAASRAVAPLTTWECPYIYIIGGEKASGRISIDIWRGVINRLMFKPLQ